MPVEVSAAAAGDVYMLRALQNRLPAVDACIGAAAAYNVLGAKIPHQSGGTSPTRPLGHSPIAVGSIHGVQFRSELGSDAVVNARHVTLVPFDRAQRDPPRLVRRLESGVEASAGRMQRLTMPNPELHQLLDLPFATPEMVCDLVDRVRRLQKPVTRQLLELLNRHAKSRSSVLH